MRSITTALLFASFTVLATVIGCGPSNSSSSSSSQPAPPPFPSSFPPIIVSVNLPSPPAPTAAPAPAPTASTPVPVSSSEVTNIYKTADSAYFTEKCKSVEYEDMYFAGRERDGNLTLVKVCQGGPYRAENSARLTETREGFVQLKTLSGAKSCSDKPLPTPGYGSKAITTDVVLNQPLVVGFTHFDGGYGSLVSPALIHMGRCMEVATGSSPAPTNTVVWIIPPPSTTPPPAATVPPVPQPVPPPASPPPEQKVSPKGRT